MNDTTLFEPDGWILTRNEDHVEMMRVMAEVRNTFEMVFLVAMALIGWAIGGALA